jgi:hypothetical protein
MQHFIVASILSSHLDMGSGLFFWLATASYSHSVFNRQPIREDIISIIHDMYKKDGLSVDEASRIVDAFPN